MPPFTTTCPACHKHLQVPPTLAGKRAKCTCGQSLLIPTLSGLPATLANAPTGPSTPLGYRGTSPTNTDAARAHEHSTLIKQTLLYTTILVLLIAGIFALRHLGSAKSSATATPSLGEDAMIEQMIHDEDGTEARAWLAEHHGRMLSGMSDTQAEGRINQWYNMGATKVYAFGGVISMTVALELPPAPSPKRQPLIDWTNQWHQGSTTPPTSDMGQKYLLVRLRL